MSKLSKFFNTNQTELVESLVGGATICLRGFDPADVAPDDWARPGLNHVSAHAPRHEIRKSIATKHRQIRIAWATAWAASIVAATLIGYALGATN